MRICLTVSDRNLARGFKRAAAVLAVFAAMCSAASAQCPGGVCPVPQSAARQPIIGGRIASAFMSGETAPRAHPVRTFFADRRALRTVFVRR